jgi:hypothetical protein
MPVFFSTDDQALRRDGDLALLLRVRAGDATLLFAVLIEICMHGVRDGVLFRIFVEAGSPLKKRFDHLHRYRDIGIAITSSACKRSDSEIRERPSAVADLRLMMSSNVADGHRQAMLVRSAL